MKNTTLLLATLFILGCKVEGTTVDASVVNSNTAVGDEASVDAGADTNASDVKCDGVCKQDADKTAAACFEIDDETRIILVQQSQLWY